MAGDCHYNTRVAVVMPSTSHSYTTPLFFRSVLCRLNACDRHVVFVKLFSPYGSAQRSSAQEPGYISRAIPYTRVPKCGRTALKPEVDASLLRCSRGSTRGGKRGARITDTVEVAKRGCYKSEVQSFQGADSDRTGDGLEARACKLN